jgi:hypothetical protein
VQLEVPRLATAGLQVPPGYSGTLVGERPEALVRCADWVPWDGRCEAAAVVT